MSTSKGISSKRQRHNSELMSKHVRALNRIDFISRLNNREKINEIIKFRKNYGISFQWKERLRAYFEANFFNNNRTKYFNVDGLGDCGSLINPYYQFVHKEGIRKATLNDILMRHYIVVELYLNDVFREPIPTEKGDKDKTGEAEIYLCGIKDTFYKDLTLLGKSIGITYPKVKHSQIFESIHPIMRDYVFNIENPHLEDYPASYYQVCNTGANYIPTKGIILLFSRLKGLKKKDFLQVCEMLYNTYQNEFIDYKELSFESIPSYANALLIRDIEDLTSIEISEHFDITNSEVFFSPTINRNIRRLIKGLQLPYPVLAR